jgi:ubiquinone/menaquinone biosynthesis C-methylase UbiE
MAEETGEVDVFGQPDFVRLHDWASGLRQEDAPFYSALAAEHGSPVLDVACATGRLAVPLARQGAEVVGLVCSREMLELVRAKVEAEPAEVRRRLSFVQDGVEDFELDRQFPTVLMPDSAVFALHGRFSLSQCFRRLYRHTEPGGVAVVDAVAPEVMAEQEVGRRLEVAEGVNPATGLLTRLTLRVTSVFWDTQMVGEVQTFMEGEGEREREFTFRRDYRWLGRDEGVELLKHAGFPEVDVLGDYEGGPFEPGCPRLILMAHRLERDFI